MSQLPSTPTLPVLILGTHITGLGLLRVMVGHGVPCQILDPSRDFVVRSRWYRPAERMLPETSDSDELGEFLQSLALPGAVLIPCSDSWTLALSGLAPDIRERFPASVASREVIEQLVDKARFRALVERLGIPYPRTRPIGGPADLDLVSDEELAGGFFKPTESARHRLVFGTKGSFVRSRAEAARLLERASAAGISLMLQDWIPGGPSNSILVDGFVDRQGTITTMMARRRIRMEPPRIANSSVAVTIPMAEVSPAVAAVRQLLAGVDYRGIFNVEFKYDARDGQFKIIEVNPRPFWLIAHVAMAGMDLAWMSYLDAQALPVPVPPPYRPGRYGLYEIPDAAALLRAWGSLRRPEGAVLAPWLRGDHALFWWSDPLPAMAGVWAALARRLRALFSRSRRSPRPAS